MAIGKEIVFDFPDNNCFGCSPTNERGLQLRFTQVSHSGVATRYTAPAHTCGAPGVVHGGVQAALLDEAIGFAMHAMHASNGELGADEAGWQNVATMEFDLRYRRPVPVGIEVGVRAEVIGAYGKDYYAVAEITGTDDEVLTSATAKWRRV
ncbi:MAG TPA: PaaI family thioesterase [Acidimicrobiales bacterium]|nr:PaaI family thioesterase [Acidimicrobiales bacterium]